MPHGDRSAVRKYEICGEGGSAMITAKDINTRRFEQAKPGYKPEEVDEFLKEIADQINRRTEFKVLRTNYNLF